MKQITVEFTPDELKEVESALTFAIYHMEKDAISQAQGNLKISDKIDEITDKWQNLRNQIHTIRINGN